MSTTNECCTKPAAKAEYTTKGEFIDIDGLKTYRTGSPNATKAVLVIYDVFGHVPQTLQGADILAQVESEKGEVQVFVPDVLDGQIAQGAWFSPNATPEQKQEMGKFFQGVGSPARSVELTPKIIETISGKYPSIESWAGLGFCWGTKVVSSAAGPKTPFKAIAMAHPSFMDPKDAEVVTVPTCVLQSKDEDVTTVKAFVHNLKVDKYYEHFDDQPHGWMTARANLKEGEKSKAEYERGYGTVIDFFAKHL